MTARWIVAGFLLAHAIVHVAYIAPRPPVTAGGPAWPFDLGNSWLLGQLGAGTDLTRWLGIALVGGTVSGFALAAAAALGISAAGLWTAGITLGAVSSLGLLALFFHPWLVLGVAIDAVVLWAALVARWTPDGLAS